MPKNTTNSDVSTGYWMLAHFVTFMPIINLIFVPILAFTAGNATKRNYYRAVLAWFAIIVLIHVLFLIFGVGTLFYEEAKKLITK